MNEKKAESGNTSEKKVWQNLELKVLDIASTTKGAYANRLDPTEDFFAYRMS